MVEDMKIRPHKMPVVLHDCEAADPLTASEYLGQRARASLRGRNGLAGTSSTMGTLAL